MDAGACPSGASSPAPRSSWPGSEGDYGAGQMGVLWEKIKRLKSERDVGAGSKWPFNYSPASSSGAEGGELPPGSRAVPREAVLCRGKPCHAVPCRGVGLPNAMQRVRQGLGFSSQGTEGLRAAAMCSVEAPEPPSLPGAPHPRLSPPGKASCGARDPREHRGPGVSAASDNRAFVLPSGEGGRREFGCPESCQELFLPQLSTCYERANKPNHAAGKQALRVPSP